MMTSATEPIRESRCSSLPYRPVSPIAGGASSRANRGVRPAQGTWCPPHQSLNRASSRRLRVNEHGRQKQQTNSRFRFWHQERLFPCMRLHSMAALPSMVSCWLGAGGSRERTLRHFVFQKYLSFVSFVLLPLSSLIPMAIGHVSVLRPLSCLPCSVFASSAGL